MSQMSHAKSAFRLAPASAEAAAAVARLSGELGYPADVDTMRARLARLCPAAGAGDHADLVLVARIGEEVVGWMHVAAREPLTGECDAEIMALVVDGAHRGRGIGGALVNAARTFAGERGARRLRVRSNVVRQETALFYQRQGFRLVKQQNVFETAVAEVEEPSLEQ